jgi:hypothetical protein
MRARRTFSCPYVVMRQTPLCQPDKTVIRRAADVHVKLCEQYSADEHGDALHFAPDSVKIERHRCRSTSQKGGRGGFSSAHDNKRLPLNERQLYATTLRSLRGGHYRRVRRRGPVVSTGMLGQRPMKREQSQPNADRIATDHIDTTDAAPPADEPASRTLSRSQRTAHESSPRDHEWTTNWRGR